MHIPDFSDFEVYFLSFFYCDLVIVHLLPNYYQFGKNENVLNKFVLIFLKIHNYEFAVVSLSNFQTDYLTRRIYFHSVERTKHRGEREKNIELKLRN